MKIKRLLGFFIALTMLLPLFAFSASAEEALLSSGKSYTIEYSTPIENAYPKKEYKTETKLTDGDIARNPVYHDRAWLEFYRGTSIAVTIDLEEVAAITKVTVGQLQQKPAGILCSRYVEVFVSEDGKEFFYAGNVEDKTTITTAASQRKEFAVNLDQAYKARYVKVVFSSEVNTLVDEICVYGTYGAEGAQGTPVIESEGEFSGNVDGISTACLMYTASLYSPEMMKYYFAYIDEQGNAVDTMFDSLVFLAMPKTSSADGFMRQGDFEAFVAQALDAETNIGALNTAIGELKDELGLAEDYKYPIFLSIPYVNYFNGLFGEYDGQKMPANSLSGRCAAVKWYIDYVTEAVANSGYKNIELKGLYWFEEKINYSASDHEEELIKYFNDYAHEKGYKTMWIPYYSSSGIEVGKSLGFDSVTMQSGYAFKRDNVEVGNPEAETVNDCAAVAKKLGMNGIEFELDANVENYYNRYTKYVSVAFASGLIENGMITMYQSGDHLYRCGKGMASRDLYDITYEYCAGTYFEVAPVIKGGATLTLQTDGYVTGKLEIVDEDTPLSKLKIAEIEKPDGVFFAAEGNGFIEAQAYDCEPGTYVARLSVTDGSNVSNTVEVTIIVEPAEGAESSDISSDGDTSSDDGGNNTIIIVVIAVVVIALAAVAAIVIGKKKK